VAANGAPRAAGGQGGGELRPVDALAALHLLELRQQRAADLGDVGGHRLALRLKAEAGAPLAVDRDAQVA